MSKTYSVAEARSAFSTILKDVAANAEPVEITRHGKPVAVVLSIEEFQKLRSEPASDFWTDYEKFRDEVGLADGDWVEEVFADVRDRSEGRPVSL